MNVPVRGVKKLNRTCTDSLQVMDENHTGTCTDSLQKDSNKEITNKKTKKSIYDYQKRKTYDDTIQEQAKDYRRYLNSPYAHYLNK